MTKKVCKMTKEIKRFDALPRENQIEDEVRGQTDNKRISCCNAPVIAGRCSVCKENCY